MSPGSNFLFKHFLFNYLGVIPELRPQNPSPGRNFNGESDVQDKTYMIPTSRGQTLRTSTPDISNFFPNRATIGSAEGVLAWFLRIGSSRFAFGSVPVASRCLPLLSPPAQSRPPRFRLRSSCVPLPPVAFAYCLVPVASRCLPLLLPTAGSWLATG